MGLANKMKTWEELCALVISFVGKASANVFTEKQVPMVESRLRRRLSELKITDPDEYYQFWIKNPDSENKILLGLLTTHHTAFFREFTHFEWIAKLLPDLIARAEAQNRKKITIWSAACSKGQEPWSLAMWMERQLETLNSKIGYEIYATDIDSKSVDEAKNGVYHRRELETAPRNLWESYWIQGKEDLNDWYKAKSILREKIQFATDNLVNISTSKSKKFDIILCRNVLIYFNKEDLSKSINSLLAHLEPQGALITGLSESLTGMNFPIKAIAPSVYRNTHYLEQIVKNKTEKSQDVQVTSLPKPLKIFCIDDSPTVHKMLKSIFSNDEFKIVGTANNGQEAIDLIPKCSPDVITLDIHMPIMDGPTFIQKSNFAEKYPIIIVSSVQRDDQSIIGPLFQKGVKDFVEKPTLENMKILKEELGQKVKMAWLEKHSPKSKPSTPAANPIKTLPTSKKILPIYVLCNQAELQRVLDFFSISSLDSADITFLVNTNSFSKSAEIEKISKRFKGSLNIKTYRDFINSSGKKIWIHTKNAQTDLLIKNANKDDFVLTEESDDISKDLKDKSFDISPLSSMPYLVGKYGEFK
jgi:chemotaxis protein methyltransferase CheR